MEKKYYIYYLCNSKYEPFYVGKTCYPKMRELQHKSKFNNRFVKLVVVQTTKNEYRSGQLEYNWIRKFDDMCYNLINKNGNSFISKDKFCIWSNTKK